jgi:predicted dehydrogenase
MENINIGIIGAGNISGVHISAYGKLPNVRVKAACDINEQRVVAYCEKHGVPEHYTDYRELLDDKSIDAVSICTWNNSHAEIAIAALKAGKDVLCEKPLAINTAQALEIQKAAKKSGKLCMVGFVRRFADSTKVAMDFIKSGRMGDIYYAKTGCIRRNGNPGGWFSDKSRSGGGPLIDLGVHMIDLCRFLMGNPKPVGVYGAVYDGIGPRNDVKLVNRYRPMDHGDKCDVEDFASAMIRFDNKAVIKVEVSFTLHTSDERTYCEIFGDKSGMTIIPEIKIAGEMEGYNVDIVPGITKSVNSFQDMFDKEIEHFIECVGKETECISPVEDGVEIMKILDAVYESAETGIEIRLD